ncbi:MAG: class I SAM-dependent methyltransferase [Candidatus Woesearchaeota archaeon]|nr:MAG: class I SAM-dependent methyltransferase [Candidatus Woesearchaeota archaeon]
MVNTTQVSDWQQMYGGQGYRGVYPSEYMVRFISGHFGKSNMPIQQNDFSTFHILDLGCGSGRHTVYLAREGFLVSAIEQSQEGAELTKNWLELEKLQADVRVGDMAALPYTDGLFDAVIDFQSTQHNMMENVKKIFAEVHRVLKKGGLFFLVVRSSEDYLATVGQQVEAGTFDKINKGDMMGAGVCHFFSREEIELLASAYTVVSIERALRTVNNGADVIGELLVTLRK